MQIDVLLSNRVSHNWLFYVLSFI